MQYALPYTEPTLPILLATSSFLLLLNVIPSLLSYVNLSSLSLIFQILIGTIYGPPLANILPAPTCAAVLDIGYIGLILLCYEGGLNTSVPQLLSDLFLSLAVAVTGIALPLLLSFLLKLKGFGGASWTQSFACGAALSATSLGTTFTLLSSAGLGNTRLGVVLTSAAMIDDVVGLVMIGIVASLGDGGVGIGQALGRPVGASIGLLAVVVAGCWTIAKAREKLKVVELKGKWGGMTTKKKGDMKFVIHTGLLIALVTAAYYAGTSVLFTAFLAGAIISWWDETSTTNGGRSGNKTYESLYAPCVERILKPFFFASIGFAIPLRQMFHASTVWKGLVYSVLMTVAKAATGIWLLPISRTQAERPPWSQRAHAPLLLGTAMVARGEIAFLIASVAESGGIFEGKEELYLIVIWAAVVCTCVGPLAVAFLVRALKSKGMSQVLSKWGASKVPKGVEGGGRGGPAPEGDTSGEKSNPLDGGHAPA